MQNKTQWMSYLIFGMNLLIVILFNGCKEKEYTNKVTWIYINETQFPIFYSPNTVLWSKFNLQPFDTVVFEQTGDGDKNVDANSFVSPLISEHTPDIVHYGNLLCDSLFQGMEVREGDGPLGMNNYSNRKLGERNFEFTFRFTNADIAKADTCK